MTLQGSIRSAWSAGCWTLRGAATTMAPRRQRSGRWRKPGVYLARQEDDGTWLLRLNRKNPPVKTKYRLSWYPPREADLSTGTFEH